MRSSWRLIDLSLPTRSLSPLYPLMETDTNSMTPYLSLVSSVWMSNDMSKSPLLDDQIYCIFKPTCLEIEVEIEVDNDPLRSEFSHLFRYRTCIEYAWIHPAPEPHHSSKKDGCKLISSPDKARWDLISILPQSKRPI